MNNPGGGVESEGLQILSDEDLASFTRSDLISYYAVLRATLNNINNLILDISLRGATLILAVIAASAYLPAIEVGEALPFFQAVVVILGIVLTNHFRQQTQFFADMLREVIYVARRVENQFLQVAADGDARQLSDLLVSTIIGKKLPGKIHIERRIFFFNLLMGVLIVYLLLIFGAAYWDELSNSKHGAEGIWPVTLFRKV